MGCKIPLRVELAISMIAIDGTIGVSGETVEFRT